MNKFNRLWVALFVSGLAFAGLAPLAQAEESNPQAVCAQQAEEDGLTGEDKVAAIKQCMEEQSGDGDAAQK